MADYAMVVGIECYQSPLPRTLRGPSLDALRFALWLYECERVPGANILLFQNKSEWAGVVAADYDATLEKVRAAGIVVRDNPSRARIAEAWRGELLSGPLEPGTLWLYWSGHGLTFPQHGEAVLCADVEEGDQSYIFLAEFRQSLRSEIFQRFTRQRIIVDACAEYATPGALSIVSFRNPRTWIVTETPVQIELDAVPVGSTAQAEDGGSLFSRVVIKELKRWGWPTDLRAFHGNLEKALAAETGDRSKLPRVRILSDWFEAGIEFGEHAEQCRKMVEMLGKCDIPFDAYQPFYLRTMGGLTSDAGVLSAASLTAKVRELLQLNREAEFGFHSQGLVEFLARVSRKYGAGAEAIQKWLDGLPKGALYSVKKKLDEEALDLVLTIRLKESAANPDGYPAAIQADLSDVNFSSTILTWNFSDLKDAKTLESHARLILNAADAQARRQKGVHLRIQVFANPPLMGVPIHAFRLNPEDDDTSAVFGRFHSFVLRSRARLVGAAEYDLHSWKDKARALSQRPCSKIEFHPAPQWQDESSEEVNDTLARVDGLLVIRDPLTAPSPATKGLYKLLSAALHRGVPLASWPIVVPGAKGAPPGGYDADLKKLFGECGLLAEAPERLLAARKSQPWARSVALFWDEDDTERLLNPTGEEPSQL
jgi:hypothetical protein